MFGGHVREVTRVTAPFTSHWSYWLVFDVPQIDADGDGPYIAAELAEFYLEPA